MKKQVVAILKPTADSSELYEGTFPISDTKNSITDLKKRREKSLDNGDRWKIRSNP